MSAKRAQLCQPEVTNLGYILKKVRKWISKARKKTILRIPRPSKC